MLHPVLKMDMLAATMHHCIMPTVHQCSGRTTAPKEIILLAQDWAGGGWGDQQRLLSIGNSGSSNCRTRADIAKHRHCNNTECT